LNVANEIKIYIAFDVEITLNKLKRKGRCKK